MRSRGPTQSLCISITLSCGIHSAPLYLKGFPLRFKIGQKLMTVIQVIQELSIFSKRKGSLLVFLSRLESTAFFFCNHFYLVLFAFLCSVNTSPSPWIRWNLSKPNALSANNLFCSANAIVAAISILLCP